MFHDSVKPNYDYRANLNKQKKRYKNYDLNSPLTKNRYFAPEKEKVIKPTPPFHPSTHVVAKDNVKLTSKQKGDMFEHYV
ncbi:hypothetical protein, partial [Candidatus Albibeggiatoa sp. nov. BB20]|uniref:hypothetical protein n=1 Tax=Candidatus Albibeggiatoa sp. nov. BB20 TaxID=3162723 RepID=UPI0033653D4D